MTVTLGRDADGNAISLEKKERLQGVYCIGSSGTGKSTLLTNMIQQDIKDGNGLCLLDPHGDLIERTIALMPPEKYEDVILLELTSPYAFGVNLFQCNDINDMEEVENTIAAVMHMLDKVYSISLLTPILNQWFLNITQTLLYNPPSSFLDIPRLFGDTPQDEKYRLKLASNVPNLQTKRFWQSFSKTRHHTRTIDSISAIENKLDDFFRPVLKTIFGQEITTINMREIMDKKKILLVKMNARWESITKLVGSVIVGQILDAAYSRSDTPTDKRKFFALYADEFQWFASSDFANLFSEARKYGIGVTIAHQTLEQVDPHIIATCKQAKTIINFRVSGENAAMLATQFDSTPPEPKMEEAGRRGKLTYKKDIVRHLIQHGHSDPAVMAFTKEYLVPLERQSRTSPDKIKDDHHGLVYQSVTYPNVFEKDRTPTEYIIMQEWLQAGVVAINELLYKMVESQMGEKTIPFLREIIDYFDVLINIIHFLGFEFYYHHIHFMNDPLKQLITECLDTDEAIEKLPEYHDMHIQTSTPEFTRLLNKRSQLFDQINAEPEFKKRFSILDLRPSRYKSEEYRYKEFMRSLEACVEGLVKEPIMTTEGGQYEVIYRPAPQQTHADKQAEIANMLTRLPNMTAYVRVAGQEHTITVKHAQPDGKRSPLSNVIKTITEWNLEDGYIRSRKEVEEEIRKRQNDDDDPGDPDGSGGGATPAKPKPKPSTPPPVATPRRRKLT